MAEIKIMSEKIVKKQVLNMVGANDNIWLGQNLKKSILRKIEIRIAGDRCEHRGI